MRGMVRGRIVRPFTVYSTEAGRVVGKYSPHKHNRPFTFRDPSCIGDRRVLTAGSLPPVAARDRRREISTAFKIHGIVVLASPHSVSADGERDRVVL